MVLEFGILNVEIQDSLIKSLVKKEKKMKIA